MQTDLPVIDVNTLSANAEIVRMKDGEKSETFNLTSVQIADVLVQAVLNGAVSPLDFAVKRKLLNDAFDLAWKNDQVKALLIEEVEKYGKEGCTVGGAKLSVTSKVTYKYDADPAYQALAESIKPTLLLMKEQEERIKAACKNNASLVDNDSGELIAAIVPHPTTKSVAVSFASRKK
jgi:hypothetical protein